MTTTHHLPEETTMSNITTAADLRPSDQFRLKAGGHIYRYVKRVNQHSVRVSDENEHGCVKVISLRADTTVQVMWDQEPAAEEAPAVIGGPVSKEALLERMAAKDAGESPVWPEPTPEAADETPAPDAGSLEAFLAKAKAQGYRTTPKGDPATLCVENGVYVVTGGRHYLVKTDDGWDVFLVGLAQPVRQITVSVWSAAMKVVAQ